MIFRLCNYDYAKKHVKTTNHLYSFSFKIKIDKMVVNIGAANEILTTVAKGSFLNAINIATNQSRNTS